METSSDAVISVGERSGWGVPTLRTSASPTVDDRSTGRGSPAFGHASSPSDPIHQLLKQVLSLPFPKMVVDGLPRRKSCWKHAPLKATFDQMKHRIQKLAWMVLHEWEAIKNGFDPFPFCVGQVGGIPRGHRSESVL